MGSTFPRTKLEDAERCKKYQARYSSTETVPCVCYEILCAIQRKIMTKSVCV